MSYKSCHVLREAFIRKKRINQDNDLKEIGGQFENLIIQQWIIRTFRSRGRGWKTEFLPKQYLEKLFM